MEMYGHLWKCSLVVPVLFKDMLKQRVWEDCCEQMCVTYMTCLYKMNAFSTDCFMRSFIFLNQSETFHWPLCFSLSVSSSSPRPLRAPFPPPYKQPLLAWLKQTAALLGLANPVMDITSVWTDRVSPQSDLGGAFIAHCWIHFRHFFLLLQQEARCEFNPTLPSMKESSWKTQRTSACGR